MTNLLSVVGLNRRRRKRRKTNNSIGDIRRITDKIAWVLLVIVFGFLVWAVSTYGW